jgi:hypothetical protein
MMQTHLLRLLLIILALTIVQEVNILLTAIGHLRRLQLAQDKMYGKDYTKICQLKTHHIITLLIQRPMTLIEIFRVISEITFSMILYTFLLLELMAMDA